MSTPVIPDGIYKITKHDHPAGTVTVASAPPPNIAILVGPARDINESKWKVTNLSTGNVSFQNVATGTYIGFQGQPDVFGKICEQTSEPVEWSIQESSPQGTFYIVVPGGPIDRFEFAFDVAPYPVTPTLTCLVHLRVSEGGPNWSFDLLS